MFMIGYGAIIPDKKRPRHATGRGNLSGIPKRRAGLTPLSLRESSRTFPRNAYGHSLTNTRKTLEFYAGPDVLRCRSQGADQSVSIRLQSWAPKLPFKRGSFLFMKYFAYILYSEAFDTYYKGQTNNVHDRVRRHNSGQEKATARYRPWKLVWYTEKKSRADATILERKLKNLSKERIRAFIDKYPKDS